MDTQTGSTKSTRKYGDDKRQRATKIARCVLLEALSAKLGNVVVGEVISAMWAADGAVKLLPSNACMLEATQEVKLRPHAVDDGDGEDYRDGKSLRCWHSPGHDSRR